MTTAAVTTVRCGENKSSFHSIAKAGYGRGIGQACDSAARGRHDQVFGQATATMLQGLDAGSRRDMQHPRHLLVAWHRLVGVLRST
jgi:hypothetical protein